VIEPGDGRNYPQKGNVVTVHYTTTVNSFFLNKLS